MLDVMHNTTILVLLSEQLVILTLYNMYYRRQYEYEHNKSLLQHTITDVDELARRTLFIGRLDRLDKAVLGVYASICLFEQMG